MVKHLETRVVIFANYYILSLLKKENIVVHRGTKFSMFVREGFDVQL